MNQATTLGAHIARLRRERGLSQEELATALAVTRSIISAWENDNRVPRPDKLAALRDVLGLPDAAMASPAARDKGVLPERMPVSQVLRQAADGLIAQLSEDRAVDGRPGYGWRRDLEDIDQPLPTVCRPSCWRARGTGGSICALCARCCAAWSSRRAAGQRWTRARWRGPK
jgi:transcriptional regulator with XRE-family HTH domain